MKVRVMLLLFVVPVFNTMATADEWKIGIGTGISFLGFSGDGGFQTDKGATDFNARSAPNETKEITDSARGIIGFAEKGKWSINFLAGELELQDDATVERDADTGDIDIAYIRGGAEVLVDYAFSNADKTTWSVTGGVRHYRVEYDAEIFINGILEFDDAAKEDWTDAIFGFNHAYAISPTTTWASRTNVGINESGSSFQLNTRVSWNVYDHWEFRTFLDYRKIDFEQGDTDDSDYFLFDVEEIRFGGLVLYVF